MFYLTPLDYYKINSYVDKSHIFLNKDTSELYVYFDGYFNQPLYNLKKILYRVKYDSEQIIPDDYFNFEHTLFADFFDVSTSDVSTSDNKKSTNNNSLYSSFQFDNCFHIPYFGYSRIDDDRHTVKCNNLNKINNYYDIKKSIPEISKEIVDKYLNNITKICFGYYFDKSIDNLPNTITWLVLGKSFNQPINKYPLNLKYLTFGYEFDQPIDNLPNILERIVFGGKFNKSIDNLPNTITHLSFYVEFNESECYKFGFDYDLQKYCSLSDNNDDNKINIIDDYVHDFSLSSTKFKQPDGEIHKCNFSSKIIKLPENLTHLVIPNCKNFINLDNLIKSTKLTHLQADFLSENFLLNLPDTLEHLSLFVNSPNKIKLPEKLKFIKMRFVNCSDVLKNLPENLETLIIDEDKCCTKKINYDLSNLPMGLKYFKFNDKNNYNHYGLEYIKFNDKNDYNYCCFDYLPSGITHLTINTKTNNQLNNLPDSIKYLWIDCGSESGSESGSGSEEIFHPQNNIINLYSTKEYIYKNIDKIYDKIKIYFFR